MRPLVLLSFFLYTLTVTSINYDCEVMNYNTRIKVEQNKLEKKVSYVIKINNAKGTRYAHIAIPFTKKDPVNNISARIINSYGETVRELKRKDIETVSYISSGALYEDDFLSHFELVHNTYPYLIAYEYTQNTTSYIHIAAWSPVVFTDVWTRNATLTIHNPDNIQLNHFLQGNIACHKDQSEEGSTTSYTATYEPFKEETYAPPLKETNKRVIILPLQFDLLIDGSLESWKQYGDWHAKLNAKKETLPATEKEMVNHLTKNISNDRDKIKALYYYLQDNHRYINVSIETGGLIPYDSDYVCKNRYGDCKALSNYMMVLLKEVGIKSNYTIINAGYYPEKIDTTQVWPGQFNHVILSVPQANDTIWLECTSSSAPFNYLGAFTQNRQALAVEANNSKLIKTPALKISDVCENYTHHIKLEQNKDVHIHTKARISGVLFDYLSSVEKVVRESEKEEILDQLGLLNGLDAKEISIDRPYRDSAYVNLTLDGTINNAVDFFGNRMMLKPLKTYNPELAVSSERKQPVRINIPRNITDTFKIETLKPVISLSSEAVVSVESPYASYSRTITFDGTKVTIIRHLLIKAGEYSLEEYPLFYDHIKKITESDSQKILFTLKP